MSRGRKRYLRVYQLRWIKWRRAEWLNAHGPCARCASWLFLEADHIDRISKEIEAAGLWSLAEDNPRRIAELSKIQVLCYECHKAKSAAEATKPLVHGTGNAYQKKRCRCDICREWRRNRDSDRGVREVAA